MRMRASVLAGLLLLAVLPVPLSTSVEGVVQMNDERRVLAQESCFVDELHQAVGAAVATGELLVTCSNPRLQANQKILQQQYLFETDTKQVAKAHDEQDHYRGRNAGQVDVPYFLYTVCSIDYSRLDELGIDPA